MLGAFAYKAILDAFDGNQDTLPTEFDGQEQGDRLPIKAYIGKDFEDWPTNWRREFALFRFLYVTCDPRVLGEFRNENLGAHGTWIGLNAILQDGRVGNSITRSLFRFAAQDPLEHTPIVSRMSVHRFLAGNPLTFVQAGLICTAINILSDDDMSSAEVALAAYYMPTFKAIYDSLSAAKLQQVQECARIGRESLNDLAKGHPTTLESLQLVRQCLPRFTNIGASVFDILQYSETRQIRKALRGESLRPARISPS